MPYVLEAQVLENIRFPSHNYVVSVRAPEIAQRTRPGQFVMAAEIGDLSLPFPLLKRALAVYSIRDEGDQPSVLGLLLKAVGDGTRRLAALQAGDAVSLIGPLGNGFDLEPARGKVNLLAVGGTGVASVLLLAQELAGMGEEVHLLYGGRTAADLIGVDDFKSLEIPVFATTDDGSLGYKGLVPEALIAYIEESRFPNRHLHIFTCGPNPMMRAVARIASQRKIPCQISVEAKMACGFGVCLGCTVKTLDSYRLACTDGPVFDAQRFIWEEEFAGQ